MLIVLEFQLELSRSQIQIQMMQTGRPVCFVYNAQKFTDRLAPPKDYQRGEWGRK